MNNPRFSLLQYTYIYAMRSLTLANQGFYGSGMVYVWFHGHCVNMASHSESWLQFHPLLQIVVTP